MHALEQHTPSTQALFAHSELFWHAVPFGLSGRQTPVGSQYLPALHGSAALQPPEHLVLSAHWFDGQADEPGVAHAPLPLHVDAGVNEPFAQLDPGQACPQVPQFAESAARFLQAPPQLVWPAVQQRPLEQFPLWHWGLLWHAAPFVPCGTHAVPLQ